MGSFKDLIVYQKAFALAMEIFEISKRFPKEERYSLTDQIRRSSRSRMFKSGRILQEKIVSSSFFK